MRAEKWIISTGFIIWHQPKLQGKSLKNTIDFSITFDPPKMGPIYIMTTVDHYFHRLSLMKLECWWFLVDANFRYPFWSIFLLLKGTWRSQRRPNFCGSRSTCFCEKSRGISKYGINFEVHGVQWTASRIFDLVKKPENAAMAATRSANWQTRISFFGTGCCRLGQKRQIM